MNMPIRHNSGDASGPDDGGWEGVSRWDLHQLLSAQLSMRRVGTCLHTTDREIELSPISRRLLEVQNTGSETILSKWSLESPAQGW